MKNFKKIAFGLLVGALAVGFSAFTSAHSVRHTKQAKVAGMIAQDFILQLNTVNNFQESASDASSGDCTPASTSFACSYQVTPLGKSNIPDQPAGYSASDMTSYLSHAAPNNWLTQSTPSNSVDIP